MLILGTPLLLFREEGAEVPGKTKRMLWVVTLFSFPICFPSFPASKLFEGKLFHVPLLIVLDSYMRVASVQQVNGAFPSVPKTLL